MTDNIRVLVTGATGFLGSEVTGQLKELGVDYLVLGRSKSKESRVISGDLVRPGKWQEEVQRGGFTHLFHLAAINKSDDPKEFYRVNVDGTKNLFHALKDSNISWVCLVSSGAVYGSQPDDKLPVSEIVQPEPLGDYAISKWQQEDVATALSKAIGVEKLCIMRISNLIGPGSSNEFFLGRIVELVKELAKESAKSPVLELGSLEGTRDFIDVRDAANALIKMMQIRACGVYNLGSGIEYGLRNMVDEVVKLGGVEGMRVVEDRSRFKSVIKRQVLNIDALVKLTGWSPQVDLNSSIKDMLNA